MSDRVVIPGLPSPDVYELEYRFWPWGLIIKLVEDWVVDQAPRCGVIVDYMCGSGSLLNGIARRRPDLHLYGNTFNMDWVTYGRNHYPGINIKYSHSLEFQPPDKADIAVVTGAIHHLKPSEQPQFVARVKEQINHNGFFIVGEEVIPEYSDNDERRSGVLRLGNALLTFAIKQQAPDLVLEAAIDLLKRDLFRSEEYKIPLRDLKAMLEIGFNIERCDAVWPLPETDFGDYFLVCRSKEKEVIWHEL